MSNDVIITCYGPFKGHPVNASSETFKILQQNYFSTYESDFDVSVKPYVLRVSYQQVESIIKPIAKSKPLLSVHLGVYPEKVISIERQCNETIYSLPDVDYYSPSDNKNWPTLVSKLPFNDILSTVIKNHLPTPVQLSQDAGKYLCQYIYHTSLFYGNGNAVFIHVPKLEDSSAADSAIVVNYIIRTILDMIRSSTDKDDQN